MIRLMLNVTHRDSYVIFDKDTNVRFTRMNPLQEVPFVSEAIKRSIKSGRLIDVDNKTGIPVKPEMSIVHNGLLLLAGITREVSPTQEEAKEDETNQDSTVDQEVNSEPNKEEEKEEKEEKKATKGNKKAAKKEEGVE